MSPKSFSISCLAAAATLVAPFSWADISVNSSANLRDVVSSNTSTTYNGAAMEHFILNGNVIWQGSGISLWRGVFFDGGDVETDDAKRIKFDARNGTSAYMTLGAVTGMSPSNPLIVRASNVIFDGNGSYNSSSPQRQVFTVSDLFYDATRYLHLQMTGVIFENFVGSWVASHWAGGPVIEGPVGILENRNYPTPHIIMEGGVNVEDAHGNIIHNELLFQYNTYDGSKWDASMPYDQGNAGAVGVGHGTLEFRGDVRFYKNSTTHYGGAVSTNHGNLYFSGHTVFEENRAGAFGGGLDIWGCYWSSANVRFDGPVEFLRNFCYYDVATAGGSARRGGAINIGFESLGSTNNYYANLVFNAPSQFIGNHVVGKDTGNESQYYTSSYVRDALGGAISMYQSTVHYTLARYNSYFYAPVLFDGNYALSFNPNGHGVGGAIALDAGDATYMPTIRISGGSIFQNNYASTLGGAIYITRGKLELVADTDDIIFRNNYDSIGKRDWWTSLSRWDGEEYSAFEPILEGNPTARRNAIYMGLLAALYDTNVPTSSKGNILVDAAQGKSVRFYDPISGETSSSTDFSFTKNGQGAVYFYDFVSDINVNTIQVNNGILGIGWTDKSDNAGDDGMWLHRTPAQRPQFGTNSTKDLIISGDGGMDIDGMGIVQGENDTVLQAKKITMKQGGSILVNSKTRDIATGDRVDLVYVKEPYTGLEASKDANGFSAHNGIFHLRADAITVSGTGGVGGDGILRVESTSGNLVTSLDFSGATLTINTPKATDVFQLYYDPNSGTAIDVTDTARPGKIYKTGEGQFLFRRGYSFGGDIIIAEGSILTMEPTSGGQGNLIPEHSTPGPVPPGILDAMGGALPSSATPFQSIKFLHSNHLAIDDNGTLLVRPALMNMWWEASPNDAANVNNADKHYVANPNIQDGFPEIHWESIPAKGNFNFSNTLLAFETTHPVTGLPNKGTGVLDVKLLSGPVYREVSSGSIEAEPAPERYELTFNPAEFTETINGTTKTYKNENPDVSSYNARVLLSGLDYTLITGVSPTNPANANDSAATHPATGSVPKNSLHNARLELSDGARLIVPNGRSWLSGLALTHSAGAEGAHALPILRFESIKPSGDTAGEIAQISASNINLRYATYNGTGGAPAAEYAGVLDLSQPGGIIQINTDLTTGTNKDPTVENDANELASLFYTGSLPLLQHDDFGALSRALVLAKSNGVLLPAGYTRPVLRLLNNDFKEIRISGKLLYPAGATSGNGSALEHLVVDRHGLNTGINNDGLHIAATLRRLDIFSGKTVTLAPPDSVYPGNVENQAAAWDFTAPIADYGDSSALFPELAGYDVTTTGQTVAPDLPGTLEIAAGAGNTITLAVPGGLDAYELFGHLQAANTYAGTTIVTSGALKAGSENVIANSRWLNLAGAGTAFDTGTQPQVVRRLTGVDDSAVFNNVATGEVLTLDNSPMPGSGTGWFSDWAGAAAGTLEASVAAGDSTFKGVLGGTGAYVKTGPGTLTLTNSGNLPSSNNITISEGKVALVGAAKIGGSSGYSGAVKIAPDATLSLDSSARQVVTGSITSTGGAFTTGGVHHTGSNALVLIGDAGSAYGTNGYIQQLTVGGGSTGPSTLAGTGRFGTVKFEYKGASITSGSPVAIEYDDYAIISPGVTRRQRDLGNPGALQPDLHGGVLGGSVGTLYFGDNDSSKTTFNNVVWELDLLDDTRYNDVLDITGQGYIGNIIVDISNVSGLWTSGRWTILTSHDSAGAMTFENVLRTTEIPDGSNKLDDAWLKSSSGHVSFLYNGALINSAKGHKAELYTADNGHSIVLALTGFPPASIWTGDPNTANGDLWEWTDPTIAPNSAGGIQQHKNWIDMSGNPGPVMEDGIARFTPTAPQSMRTVYVENSASPHPETKRSGVHTYGMEVTEGADDYVFEPDPNYTGTELTISPFALLTHYAPPNSPGTLNPPDTGSHLLIGEDSAAVFNLRVNAPTVIVNGTATFNEGLYLNVDSTDIDAYLTSPLGITDPVARSAMVDALLGDGRGNRRLGLLQISGTPAKSAKVTIQTKFDELTPNGDIQIDLNDFGILRFQKCDVPLNGPIFTGSGRLEIGTDSNVSFGSSVRFGTSLSSTADERYTSPIAIHIEDRANFEVYMIANAALNGQPGSIHQFLTGPISGPPGATFTVSGPTSAMFDFALVFANDFNTFQGNLVVGSGDLRLEGRIGVVAEDFDNYPGSLAPTRYLHGNYAGDIEIVGDGTLDLARNDSPDPAAAYDTIGVSGKWTPGASSVPGVAGMYVSSSNYQILRGKLTNGASTPISPPSPNGEEATLRKSGNSPVYFQGDASSYFGHTKIENGLFSINSATPYGLSASYGSFHVGRSTAGGAAPAPGILQTASRTHIRTKDFALYTGATLIAGPAYFSAPSVAPGLRIEATQITIEGGTNIVFHTGKAMVSLLGNGTAQNPNGTTQTPQPAAGAIWLDVAGPVALSASTGGKIQIGVVPTYIPAIEDLEFLLMENVAIAGAGTTDLDARSSEMLALFTKTENFNLVSGIWELVWRNNEKLYIIRASWTGVPSVPEPSTYALCGGLGVLLFAFHRRRQNRKRHRVVSGKFRTFVEACGGRGKVYCWFFCRLFCGSLWTGVDRP
jgi:hypothetical protein